jgi:hypothetical protein
LKVLPIRKRNNVILSTGIQPRIFFQYKLEIKKMICKIIGCGQELTDAEQRKGGVCYFCRVKQAHELKLGYPDKEQYGRPEVPSPDEIVANQAKEAKKIKLVENTIKPQKPSSIVNEFSIPKNVEELEQLMPLRSRDLKETVIRRQIGDGSWNIKLTIPLELHPRVIESFEVMLDSVLTNYARILIFGEMAPEVVTEMIERNQPKEGASEEK